MSLIFFDGFETGDALTKWTSVADVGYMAGRNGQGLYVEDGGSSHIRKQMDAADEHATFIIGKAYRSSTGAVGNNSAWVGGGAFFGNIFSFVSDNGATCHITISAHLDTIYVYRGLANGTLLGSYTVPAPSYSDWYYFEAKAVLHDSAGSVEVKMNGATIINLTGIDTKNGGTKAVFDGVAVGAPQTENNVHGLMDDFYVCNGAGSINNNFLGDVAVETLYPSGNGSSSQFMGSDGNSVDNYLLVDETGTPVLTDYVEETVSGERDLYAIANLVRTSGPIYGVQVTDHVRNSDSGAVSCKVSLKSGATLVAGADFPVDTTWKTARKLWELNPDGSVAWDIAAVNAIEAGVEVV